MAYTRQSMPDSSLGFQAGFMRTCEVVPSSRTARSAPPRDTAATRSFDRYGPTLKATQEQMDDFLSQLPY